jgi:hypothetical protein
LVSVELWDQGRKRKNAQFLGGEMRRVRAHYNHLKKRVGRKKIKHAANWIKTRVGNKEKRKVNGILNKATKKTVNRAETLKKSGYEPVIVF